MSRIRQMNEQKAGKQNTSTTQSGYYGGATSGKAKKSKSSHKGKRGH